jgi:hypothetical protein
MEKLQITIFVNLMGKAQTIILLRNYSLPTRAGKNKKNMRKKCARVSQKKGKFSNFHRA